jgi:AcrR family transcriptional regulator
MSDRTAEAQRLLALVADYILQHGVAAATLSGLARAVGSNNRMLLYYFGSREQLLAAASVEAYGRFPRVRAVMTTVEEPGGPTWSRFHEGWLELAAPENLPYLRLLFELFGLAAHSPDANAPFLEEVGAEWPGRIRAVLRARNAGDTDAAARASAILALWRGLQLALLAGTDRAALDATHLVAIQALLPDPDAREVPKNAQN